jgi:hypothetical protein
MPAGGMSAAKWVPNPMARRGEQPNLECMPMYTQLRGSAHSVVAVKVTFNAHGTWDVSLPDGSSSVTCATLEDATNFAHAYAAAHKPYELVIHDAYHRVMVRETVGEAGTTTREPGSELA